MYKILTGYGFYICVVFTVILCFSANVYTDEIKNNRYSAFAALRNFDKNFMLTDTQFCSFQVMLKGGSGWLSMFIPIISAFAFIPLVCDEYEAKSVRFEIFRSTKLTYNFSRFVTACISGGLAVMLGFLIFTFIEYQLFPNLSDYDTLSREMYYEMMSSQYPKLETTGTALPLFIKACEMFLYGAMYAFPAVTLTCVIRNKYLVMCIPFFIKYAVGQSYLKMMSQSYADFENPNEKLSRISTIINPDAISDLNTYGKSIKPILAYNVSLFIICLIFYLTVQSRRCDSGE